MKGKGRSVFEIFLAPTLAANIIFQTTGYRVEKICTCCDSTLLTFPFRYPPILVSRASSGPLSLARNPGDATEMSP